MSEAASLCKKNDRAVKFDYDLLVPVIIIGDSGTGKSALLRRFADDAFDANFVPTIGVDFAVRTVSVGDKEVKCQVWDTAGQERFRNITRAYFRGAKIVLLVYDVTDAETFRNVAKWMNDVQQYCQSTVEVILVASKVDMTKRRVVDEQAGQECAEQYGIPYIETSAKTSFNVDNAFFQIVGRWVTRVPHVVASPARPVELEAEPVKFRCCAIM